MRIVYGVAGEGYGHALRSKTIIDHLSKKNEVLVLCGGKAYEYFSKCYKNTKEIYAFRIGFKNNGVKLMKTLYENIGLPIYSLSTMNLLRKIKKEFDPDLVISDFEPFTSYFAWFYGIPILNIDNQQIVTRTNVKTGGGTIDRLTSKFLIKLFSPKTDHSVITTFFYPKVNKKNTFLVAPIVRENIISKKIKKGKHILVYLSTEYHDSIDVLKRSNREFIVYGLNKDKKEGNVTLRKFSESKFINDLSSAKAAICNGGFTTISEALYFKKPILCIPIKGHYEQYVNAEKIEERGFGLNAEKLDDKTLNKFVDNIEKYEKNTKKINSQGNKKTFSLINKIIKKI